MTSLEERLRNDLRQARKSREGPAVEAIRMLLSVLDHAGAVDVGSWEASHVGGPTEVPRRHVTDAELIELFQAEAEDYRAAALEYRRLGQADAADEMDAKASVVERYLT